MQGRFQISHDEHENCVCNSSQLSIRDIVRKSTRVRNEASEEQVGSCSFHSLHSPLVHS